MMRHHGRVLVKGFFMTVFEAPDRLKKTVTISQPF